MNNIQKLAELGQSIWIDNIQRKLLTGGGLQVGDQIVLNPPTNLFTSGGPRGGPGGGNGGRGGDEHGHESGRDRQHPAARVRVRPRASVHSHVSVDGGPSAAGIQQVADETPNGPEEVPVEG